jgi:uncharacterized protein
MCKGISITENAHMNARISLYTLLVALFMGLAQAQMPNTKPPATAGQAFSSALSALKNGKIGQALDDLDYAATRGLMQANWKLAEMFAFGDGVEQNAIKAFRFYERIVLSKDQLKATISERKMMAQSYVALGKYHLQGIQGTEININKTKALEMFSQAATYFGDPEAQFQLAMLLINGDAKDKSDIVKAGRWLLLSANKAHPLAQAQLGYMLFTGGDLPRDASKGLMYLTLARESMEKHEAWIIEKYNEVMANASDIERQTALILMQKWLEKRE